MRKLVEPRRTRSVPADDSNEQRLLDAAIRCIETHGVGKTILDDIAREANSSRRTVYRVFGSRRELLEKVVIRTVASFRDRQELALCRDASGELAWVR
jgi:AcrR family transcriptional regulator